MNSLAKAEVIISKMYRECCLLRDIVVRINNDDGGHEIGHLRNESYETFLKSTIVAFPQKMPDFSTSKQNKHKEWTFSEDAWSICMGNEFKNSRHLSRFFGSALMPFLDDNNEERRENRIKDDVRLSSFTNWKCWDTLQEDLGDLLFLSLLQRGSFFVLIPTGNVYQITGPPTVDFIKVSEKRPLNVESFGFPPSKRSNVSQPTTPKATTSLLPSHPPPPPHTIEYETKGQPLLIPWESFIYVRNFNIGFPGSHFLEQLRKEAKDNETLIISKMFQEIFAEDSVLGMTTDDISILNSNQELQRLLLKFFRNHCACKFTKLVSVHCSLPSSLESKKKKNTKKSKKKMKEELISKDVPDIPRVEVHRLLRSLVHRIVPLELFGSNRNKTQFQKFLGIFLRVDLKDSLSIDHLMDGVVIEEECHWIPLQFDRKMREKCYIRLLTWIFVDYVVPCLGGLFYVTTLDKQRRRLFYLNKSYVSACVSSYINGTLSRSILIELTEQEKMKQTATNSGYRIGNIRVVPKNLSVRPIMKIQTIGTEQQKITDRKWQKILLSCMSYRMAKFDVTKPKMNGLRDINLLWLDLIEGWKAKGRPKLYFVKSDIVNCFGTINRQKLRESLVEVFEAVPPTTIHSYCLLYDTKDGVSTKRFLRCVTTEDGSVFQHVMKRRSGRALVIDLDRPTILEGRDVIQRVMNYIDRMVVKIGSRYFSMQQGIAQGCPLSAILCNLYYAVMEKQHLSEFESKEPRKTAEILVRFMDDYLYVTPDLGKATRFLDTLTEGIVPFNCTINVNKTQTNFEYRARQSGINIHCLGDDDHIQWYGMSVNQHTLETSVDYFRYSGQSIASSMSLEEPSKEGLRNKILNVAALNVANIYLDSRINSRTTVIRNLYHISLMLAFRIHGLVGKLHRSEHPDKHPTFYTKLVVDCVNVVYQMIRSLTRKASLRYELRANDTKWIFVTGFLKKLLLNRGKYDKVILSLRTKEIKFRRGIKKEDIKEYRQVIGRGLPKSFESMLD